MLMTRLTWLIVDASDVEAVISGEERFRTCQHSLLQWHFDAVIPLPLTVTSGSEALPDPDARGRMRLGRRLANADEAVRATATGVIEWMPFMMIV